MKNWIHISYYETCKGKNMQTVYFSLTQTPWCLGQLVEIHKTITTCLFILKNLTDIYLS